MQRFGLSELVFSAKSFTAAAAALYIASSMGLPRPFWAVVTAYVVAQPLSGAVRSKALYRVCGTFLGASASVALVPNLVNAPVLLSLALACWVGGCIYVSLLDRSPRSYVFLLAGYSAAIISFPTVTAPDAIFDTALARVEEITLGILCATVIHSLVWPKSLGPVLLARLDAALRQAEQASRDVLSAASSRDTDQDRRQLAATITELRLLATHLPFDTSNLRWTSAIVRVLHDRLALLLPLQLGIEDRLGALRPLDEKLSQVLLDIRNSLEQPEPRDIAAAELHSHLDDVTKPIDADADWTDLLRASLTERLHALVDIHTDCRQLRAQLVSEEHELPSHLQELMRERTREPLHADRGLALLSAVAVFVAVFVSCLFWIWTAWPSGSAAAMMAAVSCSIFATQDDPVPAISRFLKFTLWSMPIAALYLLALLPAIYDYVTLIAMMAPVFLGLGLYLADPATTSVAMPLIFGVGGALSLQDTGNADFASFINSMSAQVMGLYAGVLVTSLMRSVGADLVAMRVLRAGWRDLAAIAAAGASESGVLEFAARMVDRVGLLAARLATGTSQEDLTAVDALNDLRIGLNIRELKRAPARISAAVSDLLETVAEHFRELARRGRSHYAAGTLTLLDNTMRTVAALPAEPQQQRALTALVGLRRGLFASAPPYRHQVPEAS